MTERTLSYTQQARPPCQAPIISFNDHSPSEALPALALPF